MLEDRHIAFFRKHAVQIITTYNGTIEDHTLTRSLPIDDARRILAHLELLIQQGLAPHINLVITPETAERLTENIAFLTHHGIRHIRLLPMHFIGWSHDALASLTHGLAQAKQWLEQNQGAVSLLNNRTPTPIPLFLSEWVIDSDGGIYTNMIILESFFRDEKKHIQVSSLQKNQDDFEQDIHSFDPEHSKLHEAFIARTLAEKFAPISSSESTMSKLFHEFITSLPACVFSHP
jgi:hypothetical protein